MILKKITFEDILPFWSEKLWLNRKSPIKPMSSMTFWRDYDMEIYNKYCATFWGVYDSGSIVGVNSGHRTSDVHYRSRGIWVDPNLRGKGIAQILFSGLEEQARQEGCKLAWSIPRKSAMKAYTNYGFIQVSEYFDEGMEFGPNAYVSLTL